MTKNILIGIHVDESPERLRATLDQLEAATEGPYGLVILDDGLGLGASVLPSSITVSATPDRRGAASCFNRLLGHTADLYVFLENGVLPGPGWLRMLIEALDADPANGLAGPSTNRAWNVQAAARNDAGGSVKQTAQTMATRYGARKNTLEPLYSLSDFCYAVTRETVEAVGAADTRYGKGPCWEMDYNIRAACAGFHGVWVMGAYVYRAPCSQTRIGDEARLLEPNKKIYQDKFRGLRLTGQKATYTDHCSGEACSHFAPANHIKIELPFKKEEDAHLDTEKQPPLVSCVMPTLGRPDFTAQAIHYFLEQDYPNRELIIVYENDIDLPNFDPDKTIRVIKIAKGTSTGKKRSEGNRHARGEIIAQWDDDDLYAPQRLSVQVAPLLSNIADISGLFGTLFFDVASREFWQCTPEFYARMFYQNVAGGTLVYRKSIWADGCDYPDSRLREDAEFLSRALMEGARLCRIDGEKLFIYLRHGKNSWRFETGRFHLPEAWARVPEPEWIKPNLSFYMNWSETVPPITVATWEKPAGPRDYPPVSCIMPTADRACVIPHAIRMFQQQTYVNRELIVVDDGILPVERLMPKDPRIRYFRVPRCRSLGDKRNLACERADGRLIVHWDDDDWFAPDWLQVQARCLVDHGADVCGMDRVYFYHELLRKAWRYVYPANERPWLCGGTLCFTKEFWERNPFQPFNIGEDNDFIWSGAEATLATHRHIDRYIARIHARNTSPKRTHGDRWQTWSPKVVEALIYRMDPVFQPKIAHPLLTGTSMVTVP